MTEFAFTDRYGGGPGPDPATMCPGQCEGLGTYPVRLDDDTLTGEEFRRALLARSAASDGAYVFIRCPECEGTGKRAEGPA